MLNLSASVIIARAIVLLIAFTVHELAHAVTADRMGDPTPRSQGRITLNPIKHLDPIGAIFLLVSGFGWAKPVMINPYNLRGNPRTSMAIVAAAGPLSNLVMAFLASLPVQLGLVGIQFQAPSGVLPDLPYLLFEFIWINLILLFFNLIPIPPLDGYKILLGILPPEVGLRLRPLEQYGFLILMGAIFLLPMAGIDILTYLVAAPASWVLSIFLG